MSANNKLEIMWIEADNLEESTKVDNPAVSPAIHTVQPLLLPWAHALVPLRREKRAGKAGAELGRGGT